MELQELIKLVQDHVIITIVVGLFVLGALVNLAEKLRFYTWYVIILLTAAIGALSGQRPLYLYASAFLLGFITAFAEIIGKFADEPIKSLQTPQAIFYHVLNGLVAVFSTKFLLLNGVASSTPLDELKVILYAGLGSMLVMRSKLFNIKVGGEDISFGPEQIVKVFFRFMERAIDRVRARSRIHFVTDTMDNIDFPKVEAYSLTMLEAAQALSGDELKEVKDKIQEIHQDASQESQLQSYRLGFLLLNNMGEDFVSELFGERSSNWLIRAPIPETSGFRIPFWGPKEKVVQYVAYGLNMSTRVFRERLGWPDSEATKFSQLVEPKKSWLKGYRLVFNKPGREDPGKQGLANIAPDDNATTECVLYQLSDGALDFLDKAEIGYRRIQVSATVDGKKVEAQTYVADATRDGLKPKREYLNLVLEGAREQRLSSDYIRQLESTPTLPEGSETVGAQDQLRPYIELGVEMINLAESEQIVRDCIVVAVGYGGVIKAEDKLKDVGVVDDAAVFALKEAIVNNPTKGVPKKNHWIDPNDLQFDEGNTVAEVRDLVHRYAIPKGAH